jgi:two-component system CheB/CheR fusion protein
MIDFTDAGAAAKPPFDSDSGSGKVAAQAQQIEQLRSMVAELLKLVESLHEEKKGTNALEHRIDQLRQANQNLVLATFGAQDLQATAEAANRRQTDFLSMLAHELRNPLAPIVMANQLLGKITDAHPQLPKLHNIIGRQVDHMTHLVDDLLDASRVSSGNITLQKRLLPLSEIIESAVETSQPFFDKRYQRLLLNMPPDAMYIHGDLVRLSQVFANLLINAAKFSSEYEHITLSARKIGMRVTVSVKDNGAGIPPDIQPLIFDLFRQGFRSVDHSQGGLGIGLSLVRTIVEMHGGSAKVHSIGSGFGSEFIITLPLSDDMPTQPSDPLLALKPKPTSASACSHRQILLIEDNDDSNETLKLLLEQEGYAVTTAFDGPGGLALARANRYDVIICDIGLPGMTGYEVVRQLRLDGRMPLPCFIACSGYNQVQDRNRAMAVGFDHYLVKPVAIDSLLTLIAAHVV